jgi:hypothetical protein
MKGLKEIFQTYESQTHTGIAVIKYGTVDFKQKLVRRDKKRSLHMLKGTIYQEDIMIVNVSCNKHYWI